MTVVPSLAALRVLLALADVSPPQGGWVRVNAIRFSGALSDRARIDQCLSQLEDFGYCRPAGSGELVYVTRLGLKFAMAVRNALEAGVLPEELTLGTLAPHLSGYPFLS